MILERQRILLPGTGSDVPFGQTRWFRFDHGCSGEMDSCGWLFIFETGAKQEEM
jgi:hypothetical protein